MVCDCWKNIGKCLLQRLLGIIWKDLVICNLDEDVEVDKNFVGGWDRSFFE